MWWRTARRTAWKVAATLTLLALVCCIVPLVAAEPRPDASPAPHGPAARCAALIAQFDEVIVSRFDYRILMLEDYELAEARAWRHQAEADCGAGRHGFGIALIESALQRIGVPPWPDYP
ncbi:MAG TPA: hypothetical protein VLE23_02675 [Geminicoccaceae bacterium]|nr:hypothetical protein [Geminicoccaceae bacterium]